MIYHPCFQSLRDGAAHFRCYLEIFFVLISFTCLLRPGSCCITVSNSIHTNSYTLFVCWQNEQQDEFCETRSKHFLTRFCALQQMPLRIQWVKFYRSQGIMSINAITWIVWIIQMLVTWMISKKYWMFTTWHLRPKRVSRTISIVETNDILPSHIYLGLGVHATLPTNGGNISSLRGVLLMNGLKIPSTRSIKGPPGAAPKILGGILSWNSRITLPETNSKFAPENRSSQKERIVFQPSIFRCELLVSPEKGPFF